MIERAFRPVDQLGDVDLRLRKIRNRRVARTQTNFAAYAFGLRCTVKLSLKSRHQKPSAGSVGIGGQNREPQVSDMSDHIRLAALLAEHVRDVGESCSAFFP